MTVAVVIPCYNVAEHIEQVIRALPADISYIVTVNDCSVDETERLLLQLQQENAKIIYLKHERNQGVGGAMLTGFRKSLELDAAVTIKLDGDNQMDPSYIPQLIKPLAENKADYTKGNRFRDFQALKQMPMIRRIGNLVLGFLIKVASGYWNIFDPTNGFVAISNAMLRTIDFERIHKRFFFESSMLIELYHANAVIKEIPMKARYGLETSTLSVTRTVIGFPPRLLFALLRRIVLRYYLFDFNIASAYILCGLPLFIFGWLFGLMKFVQYANSHIRAPTGTVVIPTLLIILGFQLLLSAVNYDVTNYPKRKE
jgi:dolichol-phosphate mannosyltransferase